MPRECLSDGVSGLVSGVANGRLVCPLRVLSILRVFKRFKPLKRFKGLRAGKRQAWTPIEGFKHFEGF